VDQFSTLAREHLLLRLRPLNRALRRSAKRQGELAAQLVHPDVAHLCVTDDHVAKLLSELDERFANPPASNVDAGLTPEEQTAEAELRTRADLIGACLPLDFLSHEPGLTPFEAEAILICAAPEIERSYERVFAYVLDDLNRRYPCIELLCRLTTDSLAEQISRRHVVGSLGRLQRARLLQPYGDAPTEARQELRIAPELLAFLTGEIESISGLFVDRAEVEIPATVPRVSVPVEVIQRFAKLIGERRVNVVGIWGPRDAGHNEIVLAIALATGRGLRRLLLNEVEGAGVKLSQQLRAMLHTATALGSMIWVQTDCLERAEREQLMAALTEELCETDCPVLMTGVHSWRPTRLLAERSYAEIELSVPGYETRRNAWSQALPEIELPLASDLAARFRLSEAEVRAVARVARVRAHVRGNGQPAGIPEQLDAACAAVTRKRSSHFATLIQPKRGPADLILSPELHHQVMEVAKFVRAGPLIDEGWGFGHLSPGSSGVKALMTGESGTGKTLAAEVIAGSLGLPMLKVDLSRIVSKWVGESERNLEMIFNEAEESHSVLVFDECESLFGRRGEIQSGTDRYANLEVGYLLQRLESYRGLAILTSNLKDQIDSAFTRRFQVILNFPLPGRSERRRIWEIAFPAAAPVEAVDFDLLQELDLTGAGIIGAARTAALLAADDECEAISMVHVVKAVARQYQREARLLNSAQLGSYAALL
jgi:hypothetical protein